MVLCLAYLMNSTSDLNISKSQRKREMDDFRERAEKISRLNMEKVSSIEDPKIVNAIKEIKRINKGNARKRQIQHIAKLLSSADESVTRRINNLTNTNANTAKNHQLEVWRENLITDTTNTMNEILKLYPETNRQLLRHLVKKAVLERENEEDSIVYFKKLYQFLKNLSDENL